MKLEEIGFYTLSNERAKAVTWHSPLQRCELILTDRCNFNCPYCRGIEQQYRGDLPLRVAMNTLNVWISQGLKNVRFSGGEPTLYPHLLQLVEHCKSNGVEHIAISTNGSADILQYLELQKAGVNDFSVSLDACCSSTGKIMSGTDEWDITTDNIMMMSTITYTTVGIVVTNENVLELTSIIDFASNLLRVHDIRVIPAAQTEISLKNIHIPLDILDKHPILKYRINNLHNNKPLRGISSEDTNLCPLVLDDMAVMSGHHFPCIIYLREKGLPIGKLDEDVRWQRYLWYMNHNTHDDPICKANCLDVCVDYNNKVRETNGIKTIQKGSE